GATFHSPGRASRAAFCRRYRGRLGIRSWKLRRDSRRNKVVGNRRLKHQKHPIAGMMKSEAPRMQHLPRKGPAFPVDFIAKDGMSEMFQMGAKLLRGPRGAA